MNFSLLPLVVAELDNQLKLCQAAVDPEEQERLVDLITIMHSDFTER